jgi:hypothetical protein
MRELTRDALFEALRQRHHYGTTGTRLFLDVQGSFAEPVAVFSDDPLLGSAQESATRSAMMGDIVRARAVPMRFSAEVIGTAPIERVDVLYGPKIAETFRPYATNDLSRRVRVLWQGAEYRGRGRETMWQGKLRVIDNRLQRFAPVNFLHPERQVRETMGGQGLEWTSVTTGNLAGIDLWLDRPREGSVDIETNIVSGRIDLPSLNEQTVCLEGGGLDRRISIYRLPEENWSRHLTLEHTGPYAGAADLPVYVRVTQSDGHQAWSSPIYLIP